MRTVDFDLNIDILVGRSHANYDVFKEVPCWWFRTRRCVFSSGVFRGESRILVMIARASGDSDACYCFCSRCLEISWNVVVDCRKLFCPQRFDLCSSCRTRRSITCITRIQICVFLNSSAFRVLSNSITQNEIMRTGAFTDNYLNQMICSDCRRM